MIRIRIERAGTTVYLQHSIGLRHYTTDLKRLANKNSYRLSSERVAHAQLESHRGTAGKALGIFWVNGVGAFNNLYRIAKVACLDQKAAQATHQLYGADSAYSIALKSQRQQNQCDKVIKLENADIISENLTFLQENPEIKYDTIELATPVFALYPKSEFPVTIVGDPCSIVNPHIDGSDPDTNGMYARLAAKVVTKYAVIKGPKGEAPKLLIIEEFGRASVGTSEMLMNEGEGLGIRYVLGAGLKAHANSHCEVVGDAEAGYTLRHYVRIAMTGNADIMVGILDALAKKLPEAIRNKWFSTKTVDGETHYYASKEIIELIHHIQPTPYVAISNITDIALPADDGKQYLIKGSKTKMVNECYPIYGSKTGMQITTAEGAEYVAMVNVLYAVTHKIVSDRPYPRIPTDGFFENPKAWSELFQHACATLRLMNWLPTGSQFIVGKVTGDMQPLPFHDTNFRKGLEQSNGTTYDKLAIGLSLGTGNTPDCLVKETQPHHHRTFTAFTEDSVCSSWDEAEEATAASLAKQLGDDPAFAVMWYVRQIQSAGLQALNYYSRQGVLNSEAIRHFEQLAQLHVDDAVMETLYKYTWRYIEKFPDSQTAVFLRGIQEANRGTREPLLKNLFSEAQATTDPESNNPDRSSTITTPSLLSYKSEYPVRRGLFGSGFFNVGLFTRAMSSGGNEATAIRSAFDSCERSNSRDRTAGMKK